ncbi:hypothetical protein J2S78_002074 [Salibacterium salarium]|uniref:hypothetical protein n=1 Tax=Salibacterium salarium TaxID=284579 RepID=UPI0027823DF2|nr:hypothetical protein [Salibacterium salarium]MDQ0299654.1 hypothetical protein [Salibacterium salarium]
MTISKNEYIKKIRLYADQIIEAADRYGEYGESPNFKTEEDLQEFKKGWLLIVDDFRVIQSRINDLEIPEGAEEKGQELREAYQKYVDYIEEKTMKFGVDTMKSGEINLIQQLEIQQSQKIKDITKELAKNLYQGN